MTVQQKNLLAELVDQYPLSEIVEELGNQIQIHANMFPMLLVQEKKGTNSSWTEIATFLKFYSEKIKV